MIGEASGPAEAFGIRAGMRLGEALARYPALTCAARPGARRVGLGEGAAATGGDRRGGRAGATWRGLLRGGRPRGAAGKPGAGAAARGRGGRIRRAARGGSDPPLRLCGRAQGATATGAEDVLPAMTRSFLAGLSVDLLRDRLPGRPRRRSRGGGAHRSADLPEKLERLGVRTLGQLAALPDAAIADRFGVIGLRALRMARGEDEPLRPRRPHEALVERIDLPEAISGLLLERALALLVDRLLANPVRRERSLRRLKLSVRLAGGGSWRTVVALRRSSADHERLRLALLGKLSELPGAATSLKPAGAGDGAARRRSGATRGGLTRSERRKRLAEAARQARAVAGRDAVMRVLDVDLESRGRAAIAPDPVRGGAFR